VTGEQRGTIAARSLLTLATFWIMTVFGVQVAFGFDHPAEAETKVDISRVLSTCNDVHALLHGIPFAIGLLGIAVAHEGGHYLACKRHNVNVRMPYLVPLIGGLLPIHSPVYSKRALFDIALAGPIAGFAITFVVLILGLPHSKLIDRGALPQSVGISAPVLLWLAEKICFPAIPHSHIYLHPVSQAASLGMLLTALNLLPIGQLDGGHILYSISPKWHKALSLTFTVLVACLGLLFWPWAVWALLLFFRRHHFLVSDPEPIGLNRMCLCALAIFVFVLCFAPIPTITI
jgi:membrane-associated protease RseP (regulator of RpoE activity)